MHIRERENGIAANQSHIIGRIAQIKASLDDELR